MSYQGHYELYLYCDQNHEGAGGAQGEDAVFKGSTQGAAILKARTAGWYVANKGNRCLCPEHNTRENKP